MNTDGTRFKIILVLLAGLIIFGLIAAVLVYGGLNIPDILVAVVSIFGTQLGNSIVPYFKAREELQVARIENERCIDDSKDQ